MRVLLTDIFFPNKFAKWRLNAIKAFIEEYDTDILIPRRINKYGNMNFDVDYEELKESHSLDKYDILIFNPEFNYLNKYNEIDGTQYNGKVNSDYMLRLKKYRDEEIDMTKYNAVYHIFLHNYVLFNNIFDYPQEKQFIHMYPGGGLSDEGSLSLIQKGANLISSNYFITNFIKKRLPNHKYIEVFGGPFIEKDQVNIKKVKNEGTLNLCFTTIGDYTAKGGHIYRGMASIYKSKYPHDDIVFHYAGINYGLNEFNYLGLLSQKELDEIYKNKIDILFNLEIGTSLNGFPLGLEGAIMGCMLFTTDIHKANEGNGYNFGKELCIVDNNMYKMAEQLKEFYENRDLLLENSSKMQDNAFRLFNHENTMGKIFTFIEKELEK